MHAMKGFLSWVGMLVGVCVASADELAVTPLTPVETPPLTTNGMGGSTYGVVGVSGTNAVFVRNGAGYVQNTFTNIPTVWTNLYLNEITSTGAPEGPVKF